MGLVIGPCVLGMPLGVSLSMIHGCPLRHDQVLRVRVNLPISRVGLCDRGGCEALCAENSRPGVPCERLPCIAPPLVSRASGRVRQSTQTRCVVMDLRARGPLISAPGVHPRTRPVSQSRWGGGRGLSFPLPPWAASCTSLVHPSVTTTTSCSSPSPPPPSSHLSSFVRLSSSSRLGLRPLRRPLQPRAQQQQQSPECTQQGQDQITSASQSGTLVTRRPWH